MTRIIQIQSYEPSSIGHGGQHRLYQNYQDLITSYGKSEVGVIILKGEDVTQYSLPYYKKAIIERLFCLKEVVQQKLNPITLVQEILSDDKRLTESFGKVPIESYLRYINDNGKPDVCILDYPNFVPIARYNLNNGINTIYYPQNLESFNIIANHLNDGPLRVDCAIKWLAEQEIMALSHERMMISLVEKSLVRGLGLSAIFYPYLPVNEIRLRFMNTRAERRKGNIDKNLFLMVGSISWGPIGEGFRWVLKNIKENGLPDGMRLIVGGSGGERFIDEFGEIKNVEIRDWIGQDELNAFMNKTSGMLIPQRSGFGAVTRIPDMACAGIPCITTEHAAAAINIPPGIQVVEDEWGAWLEAMRNISANPIMNTLEEYETWETNQPKPLKEAIEKYLP